MKKKIIFIFSFILVAWFLASCEERCKFCKTVTYENGTVVNETDDIEYCGADLVKQEAIPDFPVGNLVTKVECK